MIQRIRDEYNEIMGDCGFRIMTMSVMEISTLINSGDLTLENIFQRDKAWNHTDNYRLIESILDSNPIPNIVVYFDEEQAGFSCLDGKQRLTILKSVTIDGVRVKSGIEKELPATPKDLDDIKSHIVSIIVYKGSQEKLANLFEAINTTGAKANGQELRRSKNGKNKIGSWILENSDVLKEISDEFIKNKIFSQNQIDRQLFDEFILWVIRAFENGFKYSSPGEIMQDDKKSLDDFYKEHNAPTSDEWKKIKECLKNLMEVYSSEKMYYKKQLSGKFYVYLILHIIHKSTNFINLTSEEKAEKISEIYKEMVKKSDDPDDNIDPIRAFKITRTTMPKDRFNSFEVFTEYENIVF